MDPVSLIVSGLATGAAKAAGELIPDGYKGLKALIQRKFSGQPGAEMALEGYEQDPTTFEAPLKQKLQEAQVDQDPEILEAARILVQQYKPQSSSTVNFQGPAQGVQIGDGGTQTNTFTG